MAQWIRRLTSDQKIPGSSPGVVAIFCRFVFHDIIISKIEIRLLISILISRATKTHISLYCGQDSIDQ